MRVQAFCTDGPLCRTRTGPTLVDSHLVVFPKREETVSVAVILLMFLAVIAMVKKIDEDRQPRAILAADSREAEDRIRLQINKQ
jgi:hypothetical protein